MYQAGSVIQSSEVTRLPLDFNRCTRRYACTRRSVYRIEGLLTRHLLDTYRTEIDGTYQLIHVIIVIVMTYDQQDILNALGCLEGF